jgi:hypothetical protein
MRKKTRIKKQLIFNCLNIVFILSFGFYFLWRLVHYKLESEKEVIYSDILAERIIQDTNPYELKENLVLTNGIYRFIGDVDNNYVNFMGYLWRIIKINEDKSITMITEDPVIYLSYGNSNLYSNSQIYQWLNSIEDNKYSGIFYNTIKEGKDYLDKTKICLDSFNDLETIGCFETDKNILISLLSVKDYQEAGGLNSYLNTGYYFWTTNTTSDKKFWYISEEGKTGVSEHNDKQGVRPVITIKANTKIVSGSGTADAPYEIIENETNTLNDAYIGEYITFNDTLWRIVNKETGKLKLVNEECLSDDEGTCIERSYSNFANGFNTEEKNSLISYLNTTYYNSFKNKEYLVKGTFYTGTYDIFGNYNYQSVFYSSVQAYIGLLSISEPFAYDIVNTFTLTPNVNNELSVFIINNDKLLYEDVITSLHYVRPSIYIKSEVEISDGDGTYLNPYVLGGGEDDI